MPIVNHDVATKQQIGLQTAHFSLAATGAATITVPLTGPKQIRKIVVLTGNNAGAAALTLAVWDEDAGNVIAAAKDIKQAADTYVVWEESELEPEFVKMGASYNGLAFDITNAGGPDAWSCIVEVLYSPRTNTYGSVYVDEAVEGVQ